MIFGLYVLFSRQPDYFDGEIIPAHVITGKDMFRNRSRHFAVFVLNGRTYTIQADYPFRNLRNGDAVNIIYEESNPENASVYEGWGYWIKWPELIISVLLLGTLYFIAHAVTRHPAPGVISEETAPPDGKMKKRKYLD